MTLAFLTNVSANHRLVWFQIWGFCLALTATDRLGQWSTDVNRVLPYTQGDTVQWHFGQLSMMHQRRSIGVGSHSDWRFFLRSCQYNLYNKMVIWSENGRRTLLYPTVYILLYCSLYNNYSLPPPAGTGVIPPPKRHRTNVLWSLQCVQVRRFGLNTGDEIQSAFVAASSSDVGLVSLGP